MQLKVSLAVLGVLSFWALVAFAMRRWGPGRSHRMVHCPGQNVRADVLIEMQEGDFGCVRPDAVACSLLPGEDEELTCGKHCLEQI